MSRQISWPRRERRGSIFLWYLHIQIKVRGRDGHASWSNSSWRQLWSSTYVFTPSCTDIGQKFNAPVNCDCLYERIRMMLPWVSADIHKAARERFASGLTEGRAGRSGCLESSLYTFEPSAAPLGTSSLSFFCIADGWEGIIAGSSWLSAKLHSPLQQFVLNTELLNLHYGQAMPVSWRSPDKRFGSKETTYLCFAAWGPYQSIQERSLTQLRETLATFAIILVMTLELLPVVVVFFLVLLELPWRLQIA